MEVGLESSAVRSGASWSTAIARSVLALCFLLALGATIGTVVVHVEPSVDVELARWFADHRSAAWDQVSAMASFLGGTEVIVGAAVVVASVTAFRGRLVVTATIALAMVGEVTTFLALQLVVDRERPPVEQLDGPLPTSSFPSGHTFAATTLYGALAIVAIARSRSGSPWRPLTLMLVCIVPAAVGVSRLYRGMHHLTDVLSGVALGVTWLALTVWIVSLAPVHDRARVDERAHELAGRRT